ncbi:MAG: hypothetical protein EXS08_16030 [Planctomycetes bacterium]|nr:hypothetical protein [Planctomycetota bacterium]
MQRTVPAHHKPFPELVERQFHDTPYSIIDTNGKTWLPTNGMASLVERKLLVPLLAEARSVARHELAHVKWSPMRLPKVAFDPRYLMALEDARINLGLRFIGIPVELSADERVQVGRLSAQDLGERDLLGFVLRAVAAQGTNAEESVFQPLAEQSTEVRDLAFRHVWRVRIELLRARRVRRKPVASFRVVRRLAAELARALEQELPRLGYSAAFPWTLALSGAGCCLGHGRDERGGKGDKAGVKADDKGGHGGVSGELKLVLAPLVHSTPQIRGGRRGRSRATSEGSLVRYPFRWPIDGALFRRTSRVRGGTVLIDTSGSMSLDAAGIDRILVASSGAALVALYSGHDKLGELRIVARDGRRADARDLVPFGRGNIVDEPALLWLARQAGPRLWISDGGVTGIGDTTSTELHRRCQEIVARGGIRRVKTIDEAVAVLARGGHHAGVV